MSRAVDSNEFDSVIPESIENLMYSRRSNENRGVASIRADILETPIDYIFKFDVPGVSESHVQVTVEDENILVIKTSVERQPEDGEEEGYRYLRLERRVHQKLISKFRLPENANMSRIRAECENGVLTVVIKKHLPPPKAKKVKITFS